jgi:hypothetical protein
MKLKDTKHIHKYIHPEPNGRESIGKCKCGAKDKAYNSLDKDQLGRWRNNFNNRRSL